MVSVCLHVYKHFEDGAKIKMAPFNNINENIATTVHSHRRDRDVKLINDDENGEDEG